MPPRSRAGMWAAGIYLGLASAAMAWVFVAPLVNPGESGESGLWLIPFALPWIALVPASWAGLPVMAGSFLLNALLLYGLFSLVRRRPT